jgi:AraC family L-rhamnose operon regulatory protein RhaS
MQAPLIFKEFEISFKNYGVQKSRPHKHAYFEFLYIIAGGGLHLVNENNLPFKPGDLFVLTPDDAHGFDPHIPTRMLIVDFTKLFVYKEHRKDAGCNHLSDFFREAEYIFQQYNHLKGNIIFEGSESQLVVSLIDRLVKECEGSNFKDELIVHNIVFLLLSLVVRLISRTFIISKTQQKTPDRFAAMVQYIHKNIYRSEKLRIEAVASNFHLNKDHLNVYFNKHSVRAIKAYILEYKIELIKTRLLYSELNIAEIAYELGFNDESHLNKLFKKTHGQTAKAFRIACNSPSSAI